ncbi:hypothetical protein NDU88_003615 [Pleurodeles waltl]|uniref:Uncharacterized protein n=1 Tax=Pleurodeles waltl TaxID=8319 RepID=A0AAV7WVT8_PLEWA|nr:hypothetical protein NDU88_003615 [Pleurodeles waltl]
MMNALTQKHFWRLPAGHRTSDHRGFLWNPTVIQGGHQRNRMTSPGDLRTLAKRRIMASGNHGEPGTRRKPALKPARSGERGHTRYGKRVDSRKGEEGGK